MKKKLLICDLDETLVFTNDINFRAYRAALEEFGYGLTQDSYAEHCIGTSWKNFLPIVAPAATREIIGAIHDRKKLLYRECVEFGRLNNALLDMVKILKANYYTAIVTTASLKNSNDILEYFELKDFFDLMITGDDVAKPKPEPDGFIAAANHFGIDPTETIIFEDAPAGVEVALRFGATVFQYIGCPKILLQQGFA
jgi:beta-phosphoglucomutase